LIKKFNRTGPWLHLHKGVVLGITVIQIGVWNYVGSRNSLTGPYLPGRTHVCIVHCLSRGVCGREGDAVYLFLPPLLAPVDLHLHWNNKLAPLSSQLQSKNWNSSYNLNNLLT